jgi:hypothetical protein
VKKPIAVFDKSCTMCGSFFNRYQEGRDFYLISLYTKCERCLYETDMGAKGPRKGGKVAIRGASPKTFHKKAGPSFST